MRVSVIAPFSFPGGGAATSRVRSLSLGLQRAGAAVKVFASADSSAPNGGEVGWRGVHCVLAKPVMARKPAAHAAFFQSTLCRLTQGRADQEQVDYLFKRLKHEMERGLVDVVLLYPQQLPLALRILKLCRRHRVKFVQQYAEMHLPDDYPYGMFTMFYLRERFHMSVIPRFADGHLVISRWLERAVISRGARQVLRVPALNNTEQMYSAFPEPAERPELFLTYVGTGSRRDCLPDLLEATRQARCRRANVKLRCVGLAREYLNQLSELAVRLNLQDHIELQGYVDDAMLQQMFADTNAFVLLRTRDCSVDACFPTRLPEFLATGRPVILTAVGDVGLYFRDRVNALLVEPGDVEGAANAMVAVAADRDLRMVLGEAGRELGAVDFDFETQGGRLFEWLENMAVGRGGLD